MVGTHREYFVLNNLLESGLYVLQVPTPSLVQHPNIIRHPLVYLVAVVLKSRLEGGREMIPSNSKLLVGNTLGGHV